MITVFFACLTCQPQWHSCCEHCIHVLCIALTRQKVASWSLAAWALRMKRLVTAAGVLLPRELGFE